MAEIKSTLELAMERTKKFAISGEEREEIKRKEVMQRATSLFHRHRDGHLSLNEILKEIERMEEKTGTMVKEFLLSQWIDALSLDDDDERTLKGVQSLKQRSIDEVKQKFHHLLSQYRGEKAKVRERARLQFEEALRKDGISGSAVEPNLEGDELWKIECGKLDEFYGEKLKEIKEHLKAL
jgi:hypothetical protein